MADAATKTKGIKEEWEALTESNPEIEKIRTKGEWLLWLQNHPGKNTHEALWELNQIVQFASKKLEEPKEELEKKEKHENHLPHFTHESEEEKKKREEEEKKKKEESQSLNIQEANDLKRVAEEIERGQTQTISVQNVEIGEPQAQPEPQPEPQAEQQPEAPQENIAEEAQRRANQIRETAKKGRAAARLAGGLASRLGAFAGSGISGISLPIIAGVIIILLIIVFLIVLLNGPSGERDTKLEGNIASCTFYRGADASSINPDGGLKFRTAELPMLINNISFQVGIPPATLAGILRVESPDGFYTNDPSFIKNDWEPKCAKKLDGKTCMDEGIYGLMQFYGPTFQGIFQKHKDELKELYGKTDVSITIPSGPELMEPDNVFRIYSIKDSIIAAAFKIRDKGGKLSNYDQDTITSIVKDYFTQCRYTAAGGTFNYCDDLWKSYSSCKATTTVYTPGEIPPPSADYIELRDEIRSNFGITFSPDFDDGKHYNYLKWAWEVLWKASNTRFLDLVRGGNKRTIFIDRFLNGADASYSEFKSCSPIPTLRISGTSASTGQPYSEQIFKYTFVHELGHAIQTCSRPQARFSELKTAADEEGYLTSYSQASDICLNTPRYEEDYAEMFTYFINRDYKELNLNLPDRCNPNPENQKTNPLDRNKPLHLKLITELLGVSLSPTQSPSSLAQFSCPVAGTTWELHTPSFQKDEEHGHCGSKYANSPSAAGSLIGACDGNTRRGKSLDIITGGPTGQVVSLPTIDGGIVSWKYINTFMLSAHDCLPEEVVDTNQPGGGCGMGYVFKTGQGNNNWVLHLVHMGNTQLVRNATYQSGTIVGHTAAIHTHISIGKDIADQQGMNQTDPGWLPADKALHICGS